MKTATTLATVLLFCLAGSAIAQTGAKDPDYVRLVDTAFALLKNDQCRPCLDFYEKAFRRSKHSALSHLRAALCAERCGDDSATERLSLQAVLLDWATCENVLNNPDRYPEFRNLASPDFEPGVRDKIRVQAKALGIDQELLARLKVLHDSDQKYRSMSNPLPPGSPEAIAFAEKVARNDSLNMAEIEAIIQIYGYPGKSMVGEVEASTAWLVIQHAPLEKQLKYLPLIGEAAQKGELRKADWALLVDRVRMRQGQSQLYGSQIVRNPDNGQWMLHPIEDEADVNRRRAEIGLEPLEEYALRFGIVWKPK